MTRKSKTLFVGARIGTALLLAACIGLIAGTASAKYMSDGSVQNGTTGGWVTPSDGVCVLGLHADGTMDVDLAITNRRDCDARRFTTSGTTKAQCTTLGTVGNDGAVHTWAGSSTCVTVSGGFPSTTITGTISLKDLDRTAAICNAKGGYLANDTAHVSATATGGCIAYGWQYRGQNANGTPLAFGAQGTAAGVAGFCSAYMDTGLGAAACPTVAGSGSGTQTATSTQAFGYIIHGSLCDYQYGITGNVDQNNTRGTWSTYKNISGVTVPSGTAVDLSTVAYDTMGECLAAGYAWTNWVPLGPGSSTGAKDGITTAALFDLTQQAADADEGCLHCHSRNGAQYNGPAERWKDSYLKTGHKNMLRKVTPGAVWAGPDASGNIVPYTSWGPGGANSINWIAGTTTVGANTYPLLYIFGDWMALAPDGLDVVVDVGGAAKYNATGTYSCASCHSTGWSNATAGICSLSGFTTSGACTGGGGTWYPSIGVQGIGTPGYAGKQPPVGTPPGITGVWDIDGINCSRCHNATVPSVTAGQITANALYTTTQPTSGGMGALAETNAGRTGLCYGCHQSPAKTSNGVGADVDLAHPENLPVKNSVTTGSCAPDGTKTSESACQAVGSIWTPTAYVPMFNGHVIGGSFLNSVHARATGTIQPNSLGKYDIVGATYTSTFKGYTCWQSASSSSPAITNPDGSEITTKAECEGLYGAGAWRADNGAFRTNADCAAAGDPAACCTGAGTGTCTTELTQGTCATCHDVHQSLFVAGQEGLRKECTSCHANAVFAADVPTAPQINLATINHLKTAGTPLENWTTDPNGACEICHMPKPTSGDFPMHVWRINPDPAYSTFPTAAEYGAGTYPTKKNANVADDDGYASAVWVDIPLACGQCHGTDGITATVAGVPPRTTAELAAVAKGMHDSAGMNCQVTFSIAKSGLTASVNAFVNCSPYANTGLTYDWDWGDGGTHGTLNPDSHLYAAGGVYSITLTAKKDGLVVGSVTRSVTVATVDLPPTAAIAGGVCTWDPNTWTMTLTDASTDADGTPVQTVYVDWGDGSTRSFGWQGASFSHTYLNAGSFAVNLTAIDNSPMASTPVSCPSSAAPTFFTISGTVFKSDGVTPLPSAAVSVKKGAVTVKTVYTLANGTFSAGSLKPGSYTLVVSKSGYTFAVPAAIPVGPSSPGNSISATP